VLAGVSDQTIETSAPAEGRANKTAAWAVMVARRKATLKLANEPNTAWSRKLGFAHLLLTSGLIDQLPGYVAELPEKYRSYYKTLLDRLEAGEALLEQVTGRAAANVEPGLGRIAHGIMIAPAVKPARRALIFFGGMGDGDMVLPRQATDLEDCHLLTIKDQANCFALCDIPRLGATYEDNLALIKAILAKLGADAVFCFGSSAGGFPALKFGLDLGARGVLAFSTPTSLDLDDEPGSDFKTYPLLVRLYRRARRLGRSMATAYQARVVHPRVLLVYGEGHERDAYFANHMAGVPGVELLPLAGFKEHTTYLEVTKRGMLPEMLGELLAMEAYRGDAEAAAADAGAADPVIRDPAPAEAVPAE
jgi:hypothetical protein